MAEEVDLDTNIKVSPHVVEAPRIICNSGAHTRNWLHIDP
jgi:hypothetical protein